MPSLGFAAVLWIPMPRAARNLREDPLTDAYTILVLFTAALSLLCVFQDLEPDTTWPRYFLPVAAFFAAAANALLLRHLPHGQNEVTLTDAGAV
ncbi:4-amino-4-deoxy-L-arabinose transferase-like glycosyltransferase [Povalibacter uvarum]|uniref:4-amino-4-deoxy-L-arabinose transferase-like glycosyltransferase n=1 Tax=Povalibacter uvarum TaxID=732238 RepID=A0A841HQH6_9GAMM|nr:4-amino-4-deoxy-L-arabinose transferase-like glycosyltransferase [Povalibacter uvarum]